MTILSRARQNPTTTALRYRAYCHCLDRCGDVTISELAEALAVEPLRLQRALAGEQWAASLRSERLDVPNRPEFEGAEEFLAVQEARSFAGVAA